jgi:hypothetical protein
MGLKARSNDLLNWKKQKLSTRNMKDAIRRCFPSSIFFPTELGLLCDWAEANGDPPISDFFELRAGDGEDFYWWSRSHAADDRLALFGAGPDGSMYCIWNQDDGREPIVHQLLRSQKGIAT